MLAAIAVVEASGSQREMEISGLDRTEAAPRHLARLLSWPFYFGHGFRPLNGTKPTAAAFGLSVNFPIATDFQPFPP